MRLLQIIRLPCRVIYFTVKLFVAVPAVGLVSLFILLESQQDKKKALKELQE